MTRLSTLPPPGQFPVKLILQKQRYTYKIRLYVTSLQEVAFDNLEVKVIGMDGEPLLKPLSE